MPNPSAFPITVSNHWKVKVNNVLPTPAQDTSKHYVLPLPPYSRSQLILFSFTETRFMSALHLSSCFHSFCVFLCGCKPVWQRDRCFICTLSDAISLCNLLLSNRRSLRIKMGNKITGHLHLQLVKSNQGPQLTNCIYMHTHTQKDVEVHAKRQ